MLCKSIDKIFFFLILFFSFPSYSQNIFWTEDFNNGCSSSCLASSYSGTNGSWTVSPIGFQGPAVNVWYVSCAENNYGAGNCSGDCGSNATLHIGETMWPNVDGGASYNTGNGFQNATTDQRTESPAISTAGKTNITLSFLYIEKGDGTNDDGSVFYSANGGTSWTLLANTAKTTVCNTDNGIWTLYSSVLSAACENISNLKIGFVWVNNNDAIGTDPSYAIDDITLSTSSTGGAPVTDFKADTTIICVNQCVNFTDLSTNTPTNWNWNFTGGFPNSSTVKNPTNICYFSPGTYTVSLTATNGNGSNTKTKNNYITVLTTPTPAGNISGSTTVCAGQNNITYSVSPVAGATSYNWTVPSGSTITSGQGTTSINVTFGNTSGNVCVTASNMCGASAASCASVTVNNCPSPVANFIAGNTTICAGQCINFTDQSTNNPTSWQWAFPGSSTPFSTQQNPANICYNSAGSFTVTLTVSNSNGSDTKTKVNYIVVNAAPSSPSNITGTTTVCIGQTNVNYFVSTVSGATSYTWTVPPGATITSGQSTSSVIVNFGSSSGNICVTANNNCGSSSATCKAITVNSCQAPVANFTANDSVLCVGQCIDFTDMSSNATNWSWFFLGASPASSSSQNPANICYDSAGTYSVTLIVGNSQGSDTKTKTSYITVAACNAPASNFYSNDSTLCEGQCINFYDASTNATNWNWSFPGGNPSSSASANPANICYANPGTYNVTLTAGNTSGSNTQTKTSFITVTACPAPVADFYCNDSTVCAGQCINFFDMSINPTGWNWTFNGASATSSTIKNPANICYNTPGTYQVTLVVSNASGTDTEIKNNFITVESCPVPVVKFSANSTGVCIGACVQFTDSSTNNPFYWQWHFGDGAGSNIKNPNHCYQVNGIFTVKLTAYNFGGSDSLIKTSYVNIHPLPVVSAEPDTAIHNGESVSLIATGGTSYLWSPSEYLSATNIFNPVANPFKTSVYYVSVTDSNSCTAKDSVKIEVLYKNVLFVPTAFSPNGDGQNDVLYARATNAKNLYFVVFSRWEEKVFETDDVQRGWDGNFNGSPMNSGVFLYYVRVEYLDGNKEEKKGNVMLMR